MLAFPPMQAIPGATVALRDDRAKRAWTVDVAPFSLAAFPVTRALYAVVLGRESVPAGDAAKPVVEVSWLDAVRFCNALSLRQGLTPCYQLGGEPIETTCAWAANGYRLPTEAEWQHACKAGSDAYHYGELDDIAWYRDNAGGSPHPVGAKAANAWGLHDMLGNVWEWCWDLYDVEVYGSYRIFRGGSWAEAARNCGATCRRRSHPTFAIDDLGFRLAQSAGAAAITQR